MIVDDWIVVDAVELTGFNMFMDSIATQGDVAIDIFEAEKANGKRREALEFSWVVMKGP